MTYAIRLFLIFSTRMALLLAPVELALKSYLLAMIRMRQQKHLPSRLSAGKRLLNCPGFTGERFVQ